MSFSFLLLLFMLFLTTLNMKLIQAENIHQFNYLGLGLKAISMIILIVKLIKNHEIFLILNTFLFL